MSPHGPKDIYTKHDNLELARTDSFCLFPVSALNAFFDLRSRYLDWQGPQSKIKFRKRLRQLSKQLSLIDQYRKEPHIFALRLLDDASSKGRLLSNAL